MNGIVTWNYRFYVAAMAGAVAGLLGLTAGLPISILLGLGSRSGVIGAVCASPGFIVSIVSIPRLLCYELAGG